MIARISPTKNDNCCGTVTNFFVLCPAELDHALGCGVRHLDLAENSMAVVGEDNTAHGVEEHLEHGLGAEAGSNDISDTMRRGGRSVRVHGGVKGGLSSAP